jgi:hypothetical protein
MFGVVELRGFCVCCGMLDWPLACDCADQMSVDSRLKLGCFVESFFEVVSATERVFSSSEELS